MRGGGSDPDRWPRSIGILGAAPLSVPIARRLLALRTGVTRISIFAQPPAGVAELTQLGATLVSSPADLAARSEIVIALLDTLAEAEAMLAGSRGLLAGVHSPTILVIGTVQGPGAEATTASRVSASTAGLLRLFEATMRGTDAEADQGRLSITLGAGQPTCIELTPVLSSLGRTG